MNRKERIILLTLAALNFTHILDFMIMMPLGNYLMPHFDINTHQFSFLVAAYTISAAISGFIGAFFVDGYDRKKFLLFAYVGFLLGTLACGVAPTYGSLLAFRLVAGLFGGLIGAQVLSIISDIYTYERRGRAMGAIMSAFAIASTIGVPFALYLANAFSWHAPFLLVGGLGFIIIPFIVYFIPPMDQHIQHRRSARQKLDVLLIVVRQPTQRMAIIFSGLIMMGHFMIIPFINPYLEFNNGYPKSVTPMVYLVGGIASFFAANFLGWMADKYGKLPVFLICIFFSTVLVYVITNVNAIPFSIILVLFAAWFVVSTGRGVTAQAMVSNVVPPEQRGSFMSFNSSFQQIGTSVAAIVSGYIVTKGSDGKIHHFEWVGYLSIIVLVMCALLGHLIFRKIDTKKTSTQVPIAQPEN
ncbi:MAG: MFS transporter [Chitinophagaceae bacterium]|nr:MFS transporter [Chitinophagaceae bacterium]